MQALPHRIIRALVFSAAGALLLLVSSQSAFAATQLTFNPTSLRFGEVVIGSQTTLTATMTNSGTAAITISTMNVSSAAYTVSQISLPLTLDPGESASFNVSFSPVSTRVSNGNVSFNGSSGRLNLYGWGAASQSVFPNPASLAFGEVSSGGTASAYVTVTNATSHSTTISQNSISSQFATSGLTLPLTLAAGQSFTFQITFSPTSVGPVLGVFEGRSSNSALIVGVPLSGTGSAAGQLTVSPPSINFGNVNDGTTASQSGTMTASGASVTVSSVTSNNGVFGFTGVQLPVTIGAGQNVGYTATFTPQNSGSASGAFTFTSNASGSSPSQSLSGTGVAQHQVSLAWDASTSPVVGYNVYRGVKSGGPYSKLNSALDPSTSYVDGSVASAQTYYYVTTAVDSGGMESGYSNQVKAVIP